MTVFLHADVYTCLKEAGALEVVYVDVVVLINTAANYIIMLLTGIICDERVSRLKMLEAAFLGGVYSCLLYTSYSKRQKYMVKSLSGHVSLGTGLKQAD